jgi:hypothetical protein
MFNLFVNDLPKFIKYGSPFLFADDCKLIFHSDVGIAEIQEDIDEVFKWSSANNLHPYLEKCNVLKIHKHFEKLTSATFLLNNNVIKEVDHIRDLGLILSSDLKWSLNTKQILKTVNSKFNLIRRNCFNITNQDVRRMIIISYILPSFTYLASVYVPNKSSLKMLNAALKRCLGWINMNYNCTLLLLLRDNGILSIGYLLDFITLLTFYKIISNQLTVPVPKFVKEQPPSALRFTKKFMPIPVQNEISRTNFWYRAVELINLLPATILDNTNYATFRNSVKKLIFNRMLSSFNTKNSCSYSIICKCTSCRLLSPKPL